MGYTTPPGPVPGSIRLVITKDGNVHWGHWEIATEEYGWMALYHEGFQNGTWDDCYNLSMKWKDIDAGDLVRARTLGDVITDIESLTIIVVLDDRRKVLADGGVFKMLTPMSARYELTRLISHDVG